MKLEELEPIVAEATADTLVSKYKFWSKFLFKSSTLNLLLRLSVLPAFCIALYLHFAPITIIVLGLVHLFLLYITMVGTTPPRDTLKACFLTPEGKQAIEKLLSAEDSAKYFIGGEPVRQIYIREKS